MFYLLFVDPFLLQVCSIVKLKFLFYKIEKLIRFLELLSKWDICKNCESENEEILRSRNNVVENFQ
jgi:hypothetical protein